MNVKTGRDPALGTAPVGKLFWKLALPAIAAQLVNVLYNIVASTSATSRSTARRRSPASV